jgi:DNA-directed RNA polymerase specialized sigma24 family protein
MPEAMTKKQLAEALLARKIKGRRSMTAQQEQDVLTDYLDGRGMGEIAKAYGVSQPTISKIIQRAISEGMTEDG